MSRSRGDADQALFKAEARTLIWTDPLPDGSRAVVKMYRRRGRLDPLRRCFVRYRAQREYGLLAHLWQRGIPCAEPLSWSHDTDRRHGHHERLVTREIPGAIPLREFLRQQSNRSTDLAPLFAIARRMHECGVAHGAFYAANVLVTAATDSTQFHLIDFAHGSRFSRSLLGTAPGDYDALDLLRSLERVMPIDDRARWVGRYGKDAAHMNQLLAQFATHRLERPWRHLRRIETDSREFADRFIRRFRL